MRYKVNVADPRIEHDRLNDTKLGMSDFVLILFHYGFSGLNSK